MLASAAESGRRGDIEADLHRTAVLRVAEAGLTEEEILALALEAEGGHGQGRHAVLLICSGAEPGAIGIVAG